MKKRKVQLNQINLSIFILIFIAICYQQSSAQKANNIQNSTSFGFTENKGQVRDQNNQLRADVYFGGQNNGLVFHLRNNGISYQLSRVEKWKNLETSKFRSNDKKKKLPALSTVQRVDISWLNANNQVKVEKLGIKEGSTFFYNQNGNYTVNSFEQIVYRQVYKGIDIKWYEKNGELECDYLCEAGADFKNIRLQIEGANQIKINKKGELVIETPLGSIIEKAPAVFQNGKILKSEWQINNQILGFNIQNLNPNMPYVIDPAVRAWGTYYGGSSLEEGLATSTDASGNVYLAGYTDLASSSVIATSAAHQTTLSGMIDAYLVKFNSNGVRQWSTYYGGDDTDNLRSCAVDASGNVYIAGFTSSTLGISTSGAHQSAFGGTVNPVDAFLVKFNSNGVRQWGTYYGGDGLDDAYGCAVDATGNVYITGSSDYAVANNIIATSGSHQSAFGGGFLDAYLAKFNTNGVRQWATFYGGSDPEGGVACVCDALGNVFMTGATTSSNAIATSGAHQTAFGGFLDAFLVKFNASGVRQWGTYYGGDDYDESKCLATDASNNIIMGGVSNATLTGVIATAASHQSVNTTGIDDGYIVKFNGNGVRQWGTYYGGEDVDAVTGCATDASGNIFLTGYTSSTLTGAIATSGNHQTTLGNSIGGYNAYLAKLSSSGTRQWGTYYGVDSETGNSCALDANGSIYLAGTATSSVGIATQGAHQSTYGGGFVLSDGFLAKFTECNAPQAPSNTTPVNNLTFCSNRTTTLTASVSTGTINWYATATSSVSLGVGTTYTTPTLSAGTYTYYASANTCAESATRTSFSFTVLASPSISVNSGSICVGQSFTISPSGANSYTIQSNNAVVNPITNSSYTIIGSNTNGCLSTNVATCNVVVNPNPVVNIATSRNKICIGETATLNASGINTYSWSNSTATSSLIVINPIITTTYSVSGTDANGCAGSAVFTQNVDACTSITSITNYQMQFQIFPNPGKDLLNIEINELAQISIYNAIGQKVLTATLEKGKNIIDTKHLMNGVYFISANINGNNNDVKWIKVD